MMRILFLALVLVGTSIPKFPLVGAESGVEHTSPFQDIADHSICTLPSETGRCSASKLRYFYNQETCACEEFYYGGCEGNGNNFQSMEACMNACPQEGDICGTKDEEDVCSLPSETGPCKALMKRYFFNKDTCACEEFNYGGCKGNGNNFDFIEDCQKACPQEGDTCQTSKCEETGTDCPELRCACTLCPDGETEWGCCSKCYQNPEECSGFTPESVCS